MYGNPRNKASHESIIRGKQLVFFSALCDLLLAALEPMSWFNVHVYRIAGYFRTDFIFEQQLRVEN